MHLKISLVGLLFFFNSSCMAQADTVWFNKNWEKAGKMAAAFYRPAPVTTNNGWLVKDYYLNGKLQMQGISLSKEKFIWDGLLTTYYENGSVKEKIVFSNGEKNGLAEVFFPSAVLALKASYLKSREHGLYIQYNEKGIIISKENYVQGNREGLSETFYSSGKIKERYHYANDERNGLYESFYENGRLKEKCNYANGEQEGETIAYHLNGNILHKGQFVNGIIDGLWQYNPTNEKNIRASLTNGKLSGPYSVFYKNKQQVQAVFDKDSLISYTSFYDNGKVFRQMRFNTDSLTEEWTSYLPDGRFWLQSVYRFNQPYGEWKFYKQGQLRRSFLFEYETLERSLNYYRYTKNKAKEEAEKNEEEITLYYIENIESYFPSYYSQAETLLQQDKDKDSYKDNGSISNYYAGDSIKITTVINNDGLITTVDFPIHPETLEVKALNPFSRVNYLNDVDGLKLILQYEQYKPAVEEVAVFAESPSANRLRVLRLSLGNGSKKTLSQKTILIEGLARQIYKTQTAGFSLAAITAAICYELYDK